MPSVQKNHPVETVPGHDHYWELWLNPEGRISYLSPSWYAGASFTPKDLLEDPKNISRIIHPDDLPIFEKHFADAVEKKIPGEMELRIVLPDQSIRWIRHCCSPFFDEKGRYTGTRGTNYDITERKGIEHIIKVQRDLGLHLDKASSLAESMQLCLQAAMSVSHVDVGAIFMLDETNGRLNLAASQGGSESLTRGSLHFAADSPVTAIVQKGRPYYLKRKKILNLLQAGYVDEKMHSAAVIPFCDKGKVIGSLHVTSHASDEMPYYSRNALEAIARQIGAAIGRAGAEQDLRASEEKYRLLVENTYDMIWTLNAEGVFMYASPSWERALGYSPSSVVGKPYRHFLHPEDVGVCDAYVRALLNSKGHIQGPEYRVRHVDGTWRWHESNGMPVRGPDDSFVSCVGISRDITQRKQSEEALMESENLYRAIFENTGAGTFISDHDTTIVLASVECEKLSGYSKGELEGKRSWTEFIVPEDLERMRRYHQLRRIDPTAVPKNYEFRLQDRHGRIKNIYLTVDIIPGTRRSIASLLDITERKAFEEEVRRNEARLRSIVETSNAGIIRMTTEGEMIFANQQIACMLGYTHEELMAGNYFDYIDPSQKEDAAGNILKLKNSDIGRLSVERRYVRKDGTPLWGYASGGRLNMGKGNYHVVLVITDTTQVREVENEKKRLEDHLRQSQKMEAIGTLAGGIAHDFNNILASMIGFTEIAVREERPDVRGRYLAQVMKSCERAKGLVDRILTFSRVSDLERRTLDIKMILKEAVGLLRASLPATIEMVQDITKDETAVEADPTQIHQIIMNLCTNAAHAMQNRNGVLTVCLSNLDVPSPAESPHPDLSGASYVRLSVKDTGCGVDAAVKDRIFEPFFTTKPSGEGTGLGLSVVYSIVKSYGGAIILTSEPGCGATFDVYLPRKDMQTTAVKNKSGNPDLRGHERILFVDDEEALVEMAKTYFESLGYRVEATTGGAEALRMFMADPAAFDVLITDMTMPGMTGADLSREILMVRPDLPVILCTGYSNSMNTALAEKLRIREFVMKPVSLDELGYVVRRALFR